MREGVVFLYLYLVMLSVAPATSSSAMECKDDDTESVASTPELVDSMQRIVVVVGHPQLNVRHTMGGFCSRHAISIGFILCIVALLIVVILLAIPGL